MDSNNRPGLDESEVADLKAALRLPRGRYSAERASQLSGVPRSTIYWWARNGYLVPDFHDEHPMSWSYRDLVFARLFTYLRVRSMPLSQVRERVLFLQELLAGMREDEISVVRSDGRILLLDEESFDRFTGEQVLALFHSTTEEFDLLAPLEALREDRDGATRPQGSRHLWGPNLARPTPRTRISPWVMAGDPCVVNSRIPTSSLYALRTQRGLTSRDVAELYPEIGVAAVEEAIDLEQRLRRAA